eukprot:14375674-Ditylum_brightwellii.AAC.1
MAKTRTNRTGAGAPENNKCPFRQQTHPGTVLATRQQGQQWGGHNNEHVQQHCVGGNPSSGRRMHSKTVQCYDAG